MNITLEQAFASIIRYVQKNATNGLKLYLDDLQESFVVPSIYFPVPTTESKKITFDTWLTEIYVDVRFMAASDWDAQSEAARVRDSLLFDRCVIDIMNEDGTISGKKLRLTEPRTQKLDERVVQMSTRLKHYFSPTDNGKPLSQISIHGPVSVDIVSEAWSEAKKEIQGG